ncbi:MAG: hypothetical protein ACJAZ2_000912 [Glaciecola sp.]|jgi:hypothetical protein
MSLTAQENKWSFGMNLFPNYSIGFLVTNSNVNPTSSFAPIVSSIGRYETGKISFAGNTFVEYAITEKLKISAGVGYLNNGVQSSFDNLIFGIPTGSDFPESIVIYHNHHNIEIPVLFKLYFGKKFYGQAGLSATLNLSNKTTTAYTYGSGTSEKTTVNDNSTPYRKTNLYANLGFGFDYLVKEKFALYIQPCTQYGFLGIAENVPLNRIMFSFGLSTGIRI